MVIISETRLWHPIYLQLRYAVISVQCSPFPRRCEALRRQDGNMTLPHTSENLPHLFRQDYLNCLQNQIHVNRETEAKAWRCVLHAMLLKEAKGESTIALILHPSCLADLPSIPFRLVLG